MLSVTLCQLALAPLNTPRRILASHNGETLAVSPWRFRLNPGSLCRSSLHDVGPWTLCSRPRRIYGSQQFERDETRSLGFCRLSNSPIPVSPETRRPRSGDFSSVLQSSMRVDWKVRNLRGWDNSVSVSVSGLACFLDSCGRRTYCEAQAMHSWRLWVPTRVGLGIADFHQAPWKMGLTS